MEIPLYVLQDIVPFGFAALLEQGKGTTDHIMPVGNLFPPLRLLLLFASSFSPASSPLLAAFPLLAPL